jgi:hypothetical protein
MNSKIIFIVILTLVAIGGLTFYAFGPGSAGHITPTVNPTSLKPSPVTSTMGTTTLAVNAYQNRDLAENYYTIQFPQAWKLGPNQPGGYVFTFTGGTAKVETMDVADNTTLELFVLSQDEPKLKTSIAGYKRVSYQKIQVNGSDSYQLTYTSTQNGVTYQTVRTYITGADKAGVITLTANATQSTTFSPVFAAIVSSFHWEK